MGFLGFQTFQGQPWSPLVASAVDAKERQARASEIENAELNCVVLLLAHGDSLVHMPQRQKRTRCPASMMSIFFASKLPVAAIKDRNGCTPLHMHALYGNTAQCQLADLGWS